MNNNMTIDEPMDTSKAINRSRPRCASVDDALATLAEIVQAQKGGDLAYFVGQRDRYKHTMKRIIELFPIGARVLDVGSHYLHQASLLSLLGYEVWGVDLPLFADAAFVKERAAMLGIQNRATASLESGAFLEDHPSSFDVVVFTEIIEHITFNPVDYWRRVYELLATPGAIYLTTPNSFRPSAFLSAVRRLFSFGGIGISIPDILGNVTYGHHWKEYSSTELREYFGRLSPDFGVQISTYSVHSQKGIRRFVLKTLGILPLFRSDIEAVVRVARKTRFTATSPRLAMHR